MIIEQSTLKGFRNFKNIHVDYEPGMNIITGGNATGKTNLLESIYFSATGHSFRQGKEEDMIHFDESVAYIDTVVNTDGIVETIEITLERNQKKQININQEPIEKISDLDILFDIITFVPDDMKIIKEGKSHRRNFLDEIIRSINPHYKKIIGDYQKVLFQRNQLLKQHKWTKYFKQQLIATDKTLAQIGAYIILFRKDYLRKLEIISKTIHKDLTGEEIRLFYDNPVKGTKYKEIVLEFIDGLKESYNKDLKFGYTNYGIHRDDMIIHLNGKSSKIFASQGQQRTALLSLKLAQLDLLHFHKNSRPVILLDDIFSELDQRRISYIMDHIKDYQSIITTTEIHHPSSSHIIEIPLNGRKD
ncbi:MAG: DNA replication/repair protein RecF [Tissierellia bacterium]|nr:DNA replication/repair protein RecF [Tissierellia bacterium]